MSVKLSTKWLVGIANLELPVEKAAKLEAICSHLQSRAALLGGTLKSRQVLVMAEALMDLGFVPPEQIVPEDGYCYYLKHGCGPRRQVTKAEFIYAERSAGFYPKGVDPNLCATSGFSSGDIHGYVEPVNKQRYFEIICSVGVVGVAAEDSLERATKLDPVVAFGAISDEEATRYGDNPWIKPISKIRFVPRYDPEFKLILEK